MKNVEKILIYRQIYYSCVNQQLMKNFVSLIWKKMCKSVGFSMSLGSSGDGEEESLAIFTMPKIGTI